MQIAPQIRNGCQTLDEIIGEISEMKCLLHLGLHQNLLPGFIPKLLLRLRLTTSRRRRSPGWRWCRWGRGRTRGTGCPGSPGPADTRDKPGTAAQGQRSSRRTRGRRRWRRSPGRWPGWGSPHPAPRGWSSSASPAGHHPRSQHQDRPGDRGSRL